MRVGLAVFALAALIGSSAAHAICMTANQDGEIAKGTLSLGTFEDANEQPEKAFILTLPAPTCLSGPDEMDKVPSADTVHIYSSDETVAQSLKQFVGKSVQVRGNAFGAHTAHHHAPIVMDISEIDEI
jgi:hypothetical protein